MSVVHLDLSRLECDTVYKAGVTIVVTSNQSENRVSFPVPVPCLFYCTQGVTFALITIGLRSSSSNDSVTRSETLAAFTVYIPKEMR